MFMILVPDYPEKLRDFYTLLRARSIAILFRENETTGSATILLAVW